MFRTLMTTTAIAALLTAGAMAQDAPATTAAPAATTEAPAAPLDKSLLATGYTETDKDNLATEIIGRQVYSSDATDAENIGDVNNLVIGPNGEVAAVIIGVGGFLGIGEKNVAVNYSELQWVNAEDGTQRFVLPTTKEALETAPNFETTDSSSATPAASTTPAATTAPADNTAPAANTAAETAAPAATTAAPADQAATPAATPAANPIDRNALTDVPLTAEEL
ncbi:MAG: hypothetical protein JWQ89_1989, partial [Devosia sp.]|uniref:PRC-barrel domain-containing protein n=1 Tax=Devosia sp. TaxID=1871048 RepID=UPI002628E37E